MATYGDPIDIDPQEALLQEVQRTAGHVEWMRSLIAEFGEAAIDEETGEGSERALAQWTPALGMAPSVWLQIYQEERKHLINAAKAAIAAGVSERKVRIVEEQAKQLALMFKAFMMSDAIGMTPAQRIAAPRVIRELIQSSPMELEARTQAFNVLELEPIEADGKELDD